MRVKGESLKEKCVNLIRQTNELGSQVEVKTREYLLAEREILFRASLVSQANQQS